LRLGDVELVYQGGALPGSRAWLGQGSQRHDLLPAGTTLGRSRDSDVVIADERASRQHAIIELRAIPQGQEWVISDLSSANGTFVNGERVRARVLRRGDEICIGDTRLRFGAP
jgi:pSer/pThr/pTyr-binding forkhead associated (FHA) protein